MAKAAKKSAAVTSNAQPAAAPKAAQTQPQAAVAAPAPAPAAAPQAVEAKPEKQPAAPKPAAPQCTATKKDGTQCTSRAKAGLAVCVDHQPVLNRLTEVQSAAWDGWVAEQDAASLAQLLGWHKVRELIGDPVNTQPKPQAVAAA